MLFMFFVLKHKQH